MCWLITFYNVFKKGWFLPTFFVLSLFSCKANCSQSQTPHDKHLLSLANSPRWHALLQLDQKLKPRILDKNFILTIDDFSPYNELLETLKRVETESEFRCKFPARMTFLQTEFYKGKRQFDFSSCSDLNKYSDFVPYDSLTLVYASEVLSSTTSMMGHVFFKASGINHKGTPVEHSIAFLSEIKTLNPFKLLYESLIVGMPGFFIVRPYQQDKVRYLNEEKRNLWEYQLRFSDYQRELIKFHIWELKDKHINYLFQDYNCSTLALYVLAVAEPSLKMDELLFVSPVDVIKSVESNHLINKTNVILSDTWATAMYGMEIDRSQRNMIDNYVESGQYKTVLGYIEDPKALLYLQAKTQLVSPKEYTQKPDDSFMRALNKKIDEFQVDLSEYKKPTKTPQDSIVSVQINHAGQLLFSFVPAARYLRSDNEQFFTESQLKIFSVSTLLDVSNEQLSLYEFSAYDVISIPTTAEDVWHDAGKFYLGYKHKYIGNDVKGAIELSGAYGWATLLLPDVEFYSLIGGGIDVCGSDCGGFLSFELGSIVDLIYDSKLLASYQWENKRALKPLEQVKIEISHYMNQKYNLNLSAAKQFSQSAEVRFTVGLDYHF
ncbi:DUF4105 domain-containing protein [Catenovulum sp. SX2]|uniref:lipoprotein N-acyltransferase Lnb domain-containing protein n=1 Tax=Catenovulum sp. SX2 TaxID=3398614 RepID=UPI003F8410DB